MSRVVKTEEEEVISPVHTSDNVAKNGDIVAGVDGAIGEVVGESELEELVPE